LSSGLAEIEARLDVARAEAADAERRRARAIRATQVARDIDDAVRRAAHEIVEDRLSSISPLLTELYQRLRPHIDWRQIEYRLRGDVRRFLSLSVGGDMNPQYLFSSGQRRAAGIAFLLSVYLSRSWAKWKTLLLDDPVQHIDDYRSLNLVEVLAALRREGRQIVCAVEDEALADLLSRRLRSSPDFPGVRYECGLGPDGVPTILHSEAIGAMMSDAFVTPLGGSSAAEA
jgi:chromosome segregation protein